MKRYERHALVLLLLLSVLALMWGVGAAWQSVANAGKWVGTSGLLTTLAGVVQLEISGLFEKVTEHYRDEERYPSGPPSNITRQIIDNPDRPSATWLRDTLYFRLRTGFWLIVCGTTLQVAGVWL